MKHKIRPAIFDPERYPEDRLQQLLDTPKDSSTIHYDEDTIPHGQCDDPIRCDCCCPACWAAKAAIVRAGIKALDYEFGVDGGAVGDAHEENNPATPKEPTSSLSGARVEAGGPLRDLIARWNDESKRLHKEADWMDGCNGRPFDAQGRLLLRIRADELSHRAAELEVLLPSAPVPSEEEKKS
jgi:hypothetical protein